MYPTAMCAIEYEEGFSSITLYLYAYIFHASSLSCQLTPLRVSDKYSLGGAIQDQVYYEEKVLHK
jgi:hypothetical protein